MGRARLQRIRLVQGVLVNWAQRKETFIYGYLFSPCRKLLQPLSAVASKESDRKVLRFALELVPWVAYKGVQRETEAHSPHLQCVRNRPVMPLMTPLLGRLGVQQLHRAVLPAGGWHLRLSCKFARSAGGFRGSRMDVGWVSVAGCVQAGFREGL